MGTAGTVLGVIRLTYGYKTKGDLEYWATALTNMGESTFLKFGLFGGKKKLT